MRQILTLAAVGVFTLGLMAAPAASASATESTSRPATHCRNVHVPVTVGVQTGPIAGTLCVPDGADTVQLLVPGYTYDRTYWQFPYKPQVYSYVRDANRAGYATLAIDPMGSGASIKPASVFATFQAAVNTVHDVVQALRSGKLGPAFNKVVGVGHSLGSLTIATEAGVFHDLDALVTTGFAHTINAAGGPPKVYGRGYPVVFDPNFSSSGLDPLYVTTIPGARNEAFYHAANADPRVIATDERLKSTQSLTYLTTGASTYNLNNATRDLNIPVLVATGQRDELFCGFATSNCSTGQDLTAYERPWYGPNAIVKGYAPANTGHALGLQKNAPTTNARTMRFIDRYVGGAGTHGTEPGTIPPVQAPKPTPLTPLAASANAVFVEAILPASNAAIRGLNLLPGIGTQQNPIPDTAPLLRTIGNANNTVLDSLPNQVLTNLALPEQ